MLQKQPTIRAPLRLTCVGTGDAFGSGGRLNSCYHLQQEERQLLLDCGSSSLIGLQRCGLQAADIGAVVISHLHGDHFGGIPYLLLAGKYLSRRQQPLTLIGPAALQQRVEAALNALYPGVLEDGLGFSVNYQTLDPEQILEVEGFRVACCQVRHGRSRDAFGLRVETSAQVVSYTGDTEWVENLIPLAQGSDLLIAECFNYAQPVASHLSYQTLLRHLGELETRRLVLTHMGPEVLAQLASLKLEPLNDGDQIVL
jgi:ribonuclease BN (tRNA processing enzyme)